MQSWWELGEGAGFVGDELALWRITCAFCGEDGNFEPAAHFERQSPRTGKLLNFDTLKCVTCAGYIMVFWSASDGVGPQGLHDFRTVPWRLGVRQPPQHWPETVARFWSQAHNSLRNGQHDAAVVMARSALQAVMRDRGAKGKSLYDEIEDLVGQRILPQLLQEWSHEVRLIARTSAHPAPDDADLSPRDAQDAIEFLDFLLRYLYDLPLAITTYRARRANGPPGS